MSLKKNIIDKVKQVIKDKYVTEEVTYVPKIDNSKLTFGNTGLIFESTVLFIDLRGSTEMLNNHNKTSVAKIHKSYYYTIVKIARDLGGEPRSFNGDSLLVFFEGTSKFEVSNAVKAAMQMKYMLSVEPTIQTQLSKYTTIDFGIGIDDGKILCAKVGIGGASDNKDLIWIGNSVNKSTVLSDEGKSPNHIYISKRVYDCLLDNLIYHEKKDQWGNIQKVNIWNQTSILYNKSYETVYYTSYCWTIE